ncbi:hypothetical protein AJ79_02316 [Helicocarpus griseus UAMH5409]|uniref:Uncharacterized protein n=1 Tax=Helicocarpus griseus UAMH5409 TaxID=1447875 RepID=A0A2B7XUT9_9EURO|nr:hypothetical protein AJ79_02316 [Helicocarpus griseus UAMH5409]
MPQFRNFFPKRPAVTIEPAADDHSHAPDRPQRPSLNLRRSRDEEPNEYKMSVVNDSGVYLPPSPTEKKSFWHRSSSQNNTRNLVDENEPFSISRESFDSYRRSFDISARSPISLSHSDTGTGTGAASRTSLDSRFSRLPTTPSRSTLNNYNGTTNSTANSLFEEPPKTAEEENEDKEFVDVGLNEDGGNAKPRKKGFFARFGDSTPAAAGEGAQSADGSGNGSSSRPTSMHLGLGFHLPGRKREQSSGSGGGGGGGAGVGVGVGQAAELGNMKTVSADVK